MLRRVVIAQLALLAGGLACNLSDLTGERVAEIEARQASQSQQLAELEDRLQALQADQSEAIEAVQSDLADQAEDLADARSDLVGQVQKLNGRLDDLAEQMTDMDQQVDQSLHPSGELLYTDDFSSTASGWEVGDYSTGRVGYGNGFYLVTSDGFGGTMWGVANQQFADLTISVEATQVQAPSNDNNDYGVACRIQPNGEGYYFLISGDGFFSILRADESDFVPLVDWTTTEAVHLGNSTNELVAVCDGANLSLTVNGERLASASDSTYSSGDLGLTATSYEDVQTEIHFDNLTVTRP